MIEGDKVIIDLSSVGVIAATLAGWLPNIAAVLAIIWTLIRIWETQTVQGWVMKRARVEARAEIAAEVAAVLKPEEPVTKSVAETVVELVQPKPKE